MPLGSSALGGSLYIPTGESAILDRANRQRQLELQSQEIAQRDRTLKVHQGTLDLNMIKTIWAQSPPGSPPRVEGTNLLLRMMNIDPSEVTVPREELDKYIDGAAKQWSRVDKDYAARRITEQDGLQQSGQIAAILTHSITGGSSSGTQRGGLMAPGLNSYLQNEDAISGRTQGSLAEVTGRVGYGPEDRKPFYDQARAEYDNRSGALTDEHQAGLRVAAHGQEVGQDTKRYHRTAG